jgi:hypothetical protein
MSTRIDDHSLAAVNSVLTKYIEENAKLRTFITRIINREWKNGELEDEARAVLDLPKREVKKL